MEFSGSIFFWNEVDSVNINKNVSSRISRDQTWINLKLCPGGPNDSSGLENPVSPPHDDRISHGWDL